MIVLDWIPSSPGFRRISLLTLLLVPRMGQAQCPPRQLRDAWPGSRVAVMIPPCAAWRLGSKNPSFRAAFVKTQIRKLETVCKGVAVKARTTLRLFVGIAMLSAFGVCSASAQSEVDPDHFGAPSEEPFDKAKASANGEAVSIQYDGKFRLPYAVQCNGKSLRPGRYSVSLRSNGKVGQATLNQKGQAVRVAGLLRTKEGKHGDDALVVEHNGKRHRLSAIQVAELEMVFDPELQVKSSPDNTPPRTERLPLTAMEAKK